MTAQTQVQVRSHWKACLIPSEHGGWSLTLEPAALGLIVAWSWQSIAFGVAALVAFMARTPLKLVLVDIRRKRWLDRTSFALKIMLGEILIITGLAYFAFRTTDTHLIWIPFIIATPLILTELYFSMRSKSRRLLPELAGTIGISSVVAIQVLSAGQSMALAIGMWAVISGRAIAAVLYVRTQILKIHNRNFKVKHSDIGQITALVIVAMGYYFAQVSFASLLLIAGIAVFNFLAVRKPANKAKIIGIQQMIFGISVVLVTGLTV